MPDVHSDGTHADERFRVDRATVLEHVPVEREIVGHSVTADAAEQPDGPALDAPATPTVDAALSPSRNAVPPRASTRFQPISPYMPSPTPVKYVPSDALATGTTRHSTELPTSPHELQSRGTRLGEFDERLHHQLAQIPAGGEGRPGVTVVGQQRIRVEAESSLRSV